MGGGGKRAVVRSRVHEATTKCELPCADAATVALIAVTAHPVADLRSFVRRQPHTLIDHPTLARFHQHRSRSGEDSDDLSRSPTYGGIVDAHIDARSQCRGTSIAVVVEKLCALFFDLTPAVEELGPI